MKNPFANYSKAFAPFFGDVVQISRANKFNVTLHCNLMDDGFDETFSDSGTATSRRNIVVDIKKYSPLNDFGNDDMWPFKDVQPQIGDTITLENGKRFSVYSVGVFDSTILTLKARSANG